MIKDEFEYEGLDEDFEDSEYVVPDVNLAIANRNSNIFEEGRCGVWSTSIKDMGAMGTGVLTYFLLLRYLIVRYSFIHIYRLLRYFSLLML